jgi:hypothetical protein
MGGLLAILGGKPEGEDESPKDMACKALFKAVKRDDYDAFKTALDDYLTYREEGESEAGESEDESGDYSEPKKSKLFDE